MISASGTEEKLEVPAGWSMSAHRERTVSGGKYRKTPAAGFRTVTKIRLKSKTKVKTEKKLKLLKYNCGKNEELILC